MALATSASAAAPGRSPAATHAASWRCSCGATLHRRGLAFGPLDVAALAAIAVAWVAATLVMPALGGPWLCAAGLLAWIGYRWASRDTIEEIGAEAPAVPVD